MSKSKLLTFELVPSHDEVEIHCNESGLKELIYRLTLLLGDQNRPGHIHLATPGWAGNELTEELEGEKNLLINQVTVRLWDV